MGPRTAMTITFFDTYSMQVDTEVDKYGVYTVQYLQERKVQIKLG